MPLIHRDGHAALHRGLDEGERALDPRGVIESTPHALLGRFLLSAFSVDECRLLIADLDSALLNSVRTSVSPEVFAFEVVDQLWRERRIDVRLFKMLLARRPQRRDEILALAAAFSIPSALVVLDGAHDAPRVADFVAEPAYIGSHKFVGRRAELEMLGDWAVAANPNPMLVFEAIGGTGKSMLTWHWTTSIATTVRNDWAGRFWYSFYERGAVMADFCQRAVAHITGASIADLRRRKTSELGEVLLQALLARPYLLVLDGLERVLVAYHRFDAAQLADEDAGGPDQIAHRDPCASICPEDDDLLRLLTSAAPSKLLISSRLFPQALLNRSRQPIPGVVHQRLAGLRPVDAEALLRACGIRGTSEVIQRYLQSHCDCHPLVTGVLAGLVHDYLPDRGHFDAWATDPQHGDHLDVASLDLVQKRNHILQAALSALPAKGRQLLSTLSLVSESVDYAALEALNPHLPPTPDEVPKPRDPTFDALGPQERDAALADYESALARRREYEAMLQARLRSPEFMQAPRQLAHTVRDLERRGLLQYDAGARRYDLHPVVRGVAAGGLLAEEKLRYGQRVVDHFSAQPEETLAGAATLADVTSGLHVVRVLLQMGQYQSAGYAFAGPLSDALRFNLEADAVILSLLRPFFPRSWDVVTDQVNERMQAFLMATAALSLEKTGRIVPAHNLFVAVLRVNLSRGDTRNAFIALANICTQLAETGLAARSARVSELAYALACTRPISQSLVFVARLTRLHTFAREGRWDACDAEWAELESMERNLPRAFYRTGDAEYGYAVFRFWRGDLHEEHLVHAERVAREGKNRIKIRKLHALRGAWHQANGLWARSAENFHEAVRMAREVGQTDPIAETRLALAQVHLGGLSDPHQEVERLASVREPPHLALAELCLALGDVERGKKHAAMAYRKAWSDGEPHVHRHALLRASALLTQLELPVPELAPYDPAKAPQFPWEQEVARYIETLHARSRKTTIQES